LHSQEAKDLGSRTVRAGEQVTLSVEQVIAKEAEWVGRYLEKKLAACCLYDQTVRKVLEPFAIADQGA